MSPASDRRFRRGNRVVGVVLAIVAPTESPCPGFSIDFESFVDGLPCGPSGLPACFAAPSAAGSSSAGVGRGQDRCWPRTKCVSTRRRRAPAGWQTSPAIGRKYSGARRPGPRNIACRPARSAPRASRRRDRCGSASSRRPRAEIRAVGQAAIAAVLAAIDQYFAAAPRHRPSRPASPAFVPGGERPQQQAVQPPAAGEGQR